MVDGNKTLQKAKIKKSQPKKSTGLVYSADMTIKGRGRGRPSGSKNRFNPSFPN